MQVAAHKMVDKFHVICVVIDIDKILLKSAEYRLFNLRRDMEAVYSAVSCNAFQAVFTFDNTFFSRPETGFSIKGKERVGPVRHERNETVVRCTRIESGFEQISEDTGIDKRVVDSDEEIDLCIGFLQGRVYPCNRPDSGHLVAVATGKPGMTVRPPDNIHIGKNICGGFDCDINKTFTPVPQECLILSEPRRFPACQYKSINRFDTFQ